MASKKGKKKSEPEFSCDRCDKTYKTQKGLDAHLKTHDISCKECGRVYKTERGLSDHMKKVHPAMESTPAVEEPKTETPKRKSGSKRTGMVKPAAYVCPFDGCGKGFNTKEEALEHIKLEHRKEEAPPEPEPEPEPEPLVPKITRIIPPTGKKDYGRVNFMFKGKRRMM